MLAGSASVPTEVSEPVSQDAIQESSDSGEKSENLPLPRGTEGGRGIENEHEDGDEDEDTDFNPFIRTNSPEASSSLGSEVKNLDIDGADSTGRHTEAAAGRKLDEASAISRKKELALISPSENGSLCDEVTELVHLSDSTNVSAGIKSMVDVDSDDAICMRTRARYSLASFTLDELETFLQETDDEDDLQKVDDDEEYRKFLAAISRGDGIHNLHCNVNGDDEDEENDADFELELEEALESEPEDVEQQRRMTRLIKRQKTAFDRSKKFSGQASRPLRPLLPFSSNVPPSCVSPLNNSFCGFTQHQIRQLHCLIYEHVQLLIQVFSLCVFEPIKSNIAAEVKDLLLEILHQRDQVLTWRTVPYPNFFFSPPCNSASVMDEGQGMSQPNCIKDNVMQSFPSGRQMHLPSDTISICSGRDVHLFDVQAGSTSTSECTSWAPYISGPVLSVLDVAPLRLVEGYVNDVLSAVQAYERCQIELDFENRCPKEHLFPLRCTPCPTQSQGEIENSSPDCSVLLSSSSHDRMPKKTMAAVLLEKAKNQPVSLVPKDIAKSAQRFCSLFNPALYPCKPPPAALTNRILFTDAEDRLLALGLMEYNTDWKAIQQRFLPCKSRHQIFVRQKNRSSSKAPENPIKAVRRIKNSPLNPEEIARIEVGLKKFKLDWVSIWRFFVPYRDPSLLPRQWRIASGTQKSYKSDANRKAKRRLCELRRKARKASKPSLSSLNPPSEKEGDSTDNAVEETNQCKKHVDKEDEAYVHEAFLADWTSDNNGCAVIPTCLPPHEGFQPRAWIDNSVSRDIQFQKCSRFPAGSPQVYLRPYRARRPYGACLVKLAPDLPPVNLPPSVRVISQSAFKSSQPAASAQILGNISRSSSRVVENHTPHAGAAPISGVDCSQKDSVEVSPCSRTASDPKVVLDLHTHELGVADCQMHPLLFQLTQDGHLPYYSPNCQSSMPSPFTFVSGKQPELGLSLFPNARRIKDAGSFLNTSSKSPERIAPSSDIVFHPLLQRTDDAVTETGTARPPCSESRQKCALVQKISTSVNNQVQDNHNNSSASGTNTRFPHCKISKLDLNIHLSAASLYQGTAEGGDLTQGRTDRLSAPASDVAELNLANDLGKKTVSVPNEISNEIVSGDFGMVATRYEGDKVSEDIASLPEIIMEQEELSDSEEELEENVEFECEEMTDSEGDSTSDSEQFVHIPNEELLADEVDELKDSRLALNAQNDPGRCLRSASAMYSKRSKSAAKVMNINSNIQSLSLNSCRAASPHSSPKNAVDSYDPGPFGTSVTFVQDERPASSKVSSRQVEPGAQYLHKNAMEAPVALVPAGASPKHCRKRVCKSTSSSRVAYSRRGNLILGEEKVKE